MTYNKESLEEFVKSNNAIIIEPLPKLNKNARINFVCNCGKESDKSFVRITFSGLFCKDCTKENKGKKRAETNLKKYGTICSLSAESIKEKSKKTCLKRYGSENPFSTPVIKEKIAKTNLEKYGAENPFGSKIIIEKLRKTAKEKYGSEFPMQNKEIKAKAVATNIIKYGVEVTSKAKSVKEKAKQTNLRLYGSEHHTTHPDVVKKAKETNLIKYGTEYSFQAQSVKEKIKKAVLEKYGVDHPLKSKTVINKIIQTNLRIYGVKYPNQSIVFQIRNQKKACKFKKYITPSGLIRNVQGYEPFALNYLFKTLKKNEDDVISDRKEIPTIPYKFDNKNLYYFPDIFVKSENKIIEVKSTFTYELHKKKNDAKAEACLNLGYKFEFWIYDNKKELIIEELLFE